MRTLLAADIGATSSRFALFQYTLEASPELTFLREQWFAGNDYTSFADVLQALRYGDAPKGIAPFLQTEKPDLTVIAPAGPVEGTVCHISNLPWVIRSEDVTAILGISSVSLINDFAAQAYACLLPKQTHVQSILAGEPVEGAPIAVTGAGTGFGKAILLTGLPSASSCADASVAHVMHPREYTHSLSTIRVISTEGGHADFPFTGQEEADFANFVRKTTGAERVIGDMIVSGSGLALIHAFVTGQHHTPQEVAANIGKTPQVLEWFARFYGRICRNFVLDTLALGGLYITGGMALRVPVLSHPAFATEFYTSAAQERLLRNVPVWHMTSPQAGLWGAAYYGVLQQQTAQN